MPCTLSRDWAIAPPRDRHEYGLSLRDVATLSPDPPYLVARLLPETRKPPTDVASTDHSDLQFDPFPRFSG